MFDKIVVFNLRPFRALFSLSLMVAAWYWYGWGAAALVTVASCDVYMKKEQ